MSLILPDSLRPLLAKPVAIMGGGASGQGVRQLLLALGFEAVIYDQHKGEGKDFTPTAARRHALVIYSPGFAPEHPWLAAAAAAGAECWGEMDFASWFWRGRVVAITGTNGKTTLTEFLTHALRSRGGVATAAGNIGYPLSLLVAEQDGGAADAFAICEVSSFQAESFRHFRAEATLWTNFGEDHLERHLTLERYFGAKWRLVVQTAPGAAFLGSSVQRFARKFDRPLTGLVGVATEEQPADPRLAETVFKNYPQRENFLLAAAWWQANGFEPATLFSAAASFRVAGHRLASVAEIDGVTFWNDSKATNFHAVEAALAGFDAPVVLIAGGRSKGGDIAGFVHRIAGRLKHVVLIGETGADLAFHASTFRLAHSRCATLAEAVRRAAELAQPGDHVLLSPGFASFDMFRSYEDRGTQFESLVRNLGTPATSLG